jgi:hypothetical protein
VAAEKQLSEARNAGKGSNRPEKPSYYAAEQPNSSQTDKKSVLRSDLRIG